ncbi:hypothetical protein DFP73DRAFT_196904 [Morchella snyderi]|nr:hypothetical protein DFP73DRAFT_196904 [Morchella snyderi]
MSMNTLPPEIMLMILHPSNFMRPGPYPIIPQRVAIKEYSKLRLVNKEFSAHITPHLFKNITIRSRECGLKRLEHITESTEIQTWVKRYSYVLDLNNPLERSTPRNIYQDYLRLLADPEYAEKLETINPSTDPQMAEIARWVDQREFDISNDLHDVHVKCLSSLPVLRSIHLTSPHRLSDQHALSMPGCNGNKSLGPTVFRAILLAMYNRIQSNASPIEEFVLKGVTEECMLLPPHFFQKAILGFQNIKTLVINIQNCQVRTNTLSPCWVLLLGRLIQSATSLESLEIEIPDSIGSIQFSTLASPFKYRSPGQKESISTEQCWPQLKSLKLRDVLFSETYILQFLSAHRKTLRTIHFENCEIRTPNSSDSQTEIAYESPPASDDEIVAPRPWSIVLRRIAEYFPPKTSLALDSFKGEQLHQNARSMRNCTIRLWQDYLSGLSDTEPSEDQRHDECCCIPKENYIDDDSSSEMGPWAMNGMHPFSFGDSDEDEELDGTDGEEEFDEDDEDMELGEGIFIHPPSLYPYPWEWPHAGYQEY